PRAFSSRSAATSTRNSPHASRSSSPRSANRSTNVTTIPATSTSARSSSSFRTSVSSRSKGPSKASRSSSSSCTTTGRNLTGLPDAPARDRHRRPLWLPALAAAARPAPPLPAPAQELPPDEKRRRAHEHDERHPRIQPQPCELVCRVDPQQFLEEASGRVVRDVEREQRGRLEAGEPIEREEEPHADQVVDELVEEGRVEGRVALVAGDAVLRVDLQPPGQVGRLAVELLVPPIAPAADALREQQARRDRIHHVAHARALAAHDDRAHEAAE